jgi:hypothetical protein
MFDQELRVIEDSDMDSLFILPLSIVPLLTPELRTARMVKNAQLKSVVEVFRDAQTGSGQVNVEDLPATMGWDTSIIHPDLAILRRLALLPSYDVYSLRISLRSLQIPVNDVASLRLSVKKMKEITDYMMAFTRPLLHSIYAGDTVQVNSFQDLMNLFRDPDVTRARARLKKLATTLGIEIMDVPSFLEDYGDTFMALSFFRHCLDRLTPYILAIIRSMPSLRNHFQLKQDIHLMRALTVIESALRQINHGIKERLDLFDQRTSQMWKNITREEFQAVKTMIERYHLSIGAALCGLTVKMNDFARQFPNPNAGGPVKRGDFLMGDMMQGIESIRIATLALTDKDGKAASRAVVAKA